jgi:hypothetical protein
LPQIYNNIFNSIAGIESFSALRPQLLIATVSGGDRALPEGSVDDRRKTPLK